MGSLKIISCEHDVVMFHAGADRIPAAAETVKRLGVRYQHYGWPGITRALDGDILVSASERIFHVDPFGRTVLSRSADGGRTWGEPRVIFDSVTDDRDCAVNTLLDGTIIATWFTSQAWVNRADDRMPWWRKIAERLTPDTLTALSRAWLRRSRDGGRTWEDSVYPTIIGQHAGPTVLSNGDILYCGPFNGPDRPRLLATRSSDGGITWSVIGEIPGAVMKTKGTGRLHTQFDENHALEIAPDHIICAFRSELGHAKMVPLRADGSEAPTQTQNRNVNITRTTDGGRTWTEPEDTGVYGFPSYLLRLAAGQILCVFGDRRGPWAIRAIVSYDDGATWDTGNVLTLWESPHVTDMGYPVALEVSPGEVLCVFYSVPVLDMTPDYENHDPRKAGILSARIRLG